VGDGIWMPRRLFRKAVQQGRSARRGEAYSSLYVEPLSDARTPLAGFVNSLLAEPLGVIGGTGGFFHSQGHCRLGEYILY